MSITIQKIIGLFGFFGTLVATFDAAHTNSARCVTVLCAFIAWLSTSPFAAEAAAIEAKFVKGSSYLKDAEPIVRTVSPKAADDINTVVADVNKIVPKA